MKALFATCRSDATPTTTTTATALRWRSSAQRISHATRESDDLLSFDDDKAAASSSMKNGIHTINEGDDGKKWRTTTTTRLAAAIAWLQQQLPQQQHCTSRSNHRATVVWMRLLPMLVLLVFLSASLWSLTIAHLWWRTFCVTIHVLLAVLLICQTWETSSSCFSWLSICRDCNDSTALEQPQERQRQLQVHQTQLRQGLVEEWNRLQHYHEYLSAQQGRVQRVHQVDAWLQQHVHQSSNSSLQESNDEELVPIVVAVCTQLQHTMFKLRQALSRQVGFMLWTNWIKESNERRSGRGSRAQSSSRTDTTKTTTTTDTASPSSPLASPLAQRVWDGWMQRLHSSASGTKKDTSIVNLFASAVTLDDNNVLKTWWFTPPVSKQVNPSGETNNNDATAAAETAAAAIPIDILSSLDQSSVSSRSNNAITIPESVVRSRVLAILEQLQRISTATTGSASAVASETHRHYEQPSLLGTGRQLTPPIPPVEAWLLLDPYQLIRSTTTTKPSSSVQAADNGTAAPLLDALSPTAPRHQNAADHNDSRHATALPQQHDAFNDLLQLSDVPLSQDSS